ncbi:MAG: HDIG domain-containing protein [Parachlamydiales bacterium]|nr:HDIG domain-containing protein [Candidatus Acheromyda pituitae]
MQRRQLEEEAEASQQVKWYRLLGKDQSGKRWALLLTFIISLTIFLHFREVQMEFLELGAQSPRYVIAQVDFNFPDVEATHILRQESVRDIGTIYKVEEKQVHQFRQDLEVSLIEHQEWRKELPTCTFEELYQTMGKIEEEMLQSRFSDERTLRKLEGLNIPGEQFYLLQVPSSELSPYSLPPSFWTSLEKRIAEDKKFHADTVSYLIHSFSVQLWNMQEDFGLEREVRGRVQENVPQKYTHVEAGSQLVQKGESVTPRHISMVQAMKKAATRLRNLWTPQTLLGSALMAVILTVVSLYYLRMFQRDLLLSLRKITLLVTIILIAFLLAKGAEHLLLYHGYNLIEVARFPLLVPFAALMVCVLVGAEIALFTSFFLIIVFGSSLSIEHDFSLAINFFAALATILFAKRLHRRKEVFAVCGKVWLSLIPLLCAVNLIENTFWNISIIVDLMSSFLYMTVTAVIVVGLLPILESLFHVMTDMTLMEYMDPNNELLRRLSLEAPGTYQHCLVVGNLAEEAARAIGANGLFCRVSTLYHDIGKLFNPHYFTENQLGGFNIHQLLTPLESTHVIIAHVPEGEALARKYHLPQSFIDVIREHHGTTMVYYFYCKQVEQMGGDATKVNEKLFRYPGPKPRSKESAIIMLADTLEAASRSMEEVNEETISDMIDKLVAEKAQDGQLDECQLTFEELGSVKKAMAKALLVTRHLRIKYPERS